MTAPRSPEGTLGGTDQPHPLLGAVLPLPPPARPSRCHPGSPRTRIPQRRRPPVPLLLERREELGQDRPGTGTKGSIRVHQPTRSLRVSGELTCLPRPSRALGLTAPGGGHPHPHAHTSARTHPVWQSFLSSGSGQDPGPQSVGRPPHGKEHAVLSGRLSLFQESGPGHGGVWQAWSWHPATEREAWLCPDLTSCLWPAPARA